VPPAPPLEGFVNSQILAFSPPRGKIDKGGSYMPDIFFHSMPWTNLKIEGLKREIEELKKMVKK